MKFKEDGTQWYNYFHIRLNNEGHYYFAWNGSNRNAFPDAEFKAHDNAKYWIIKHNWRQAVDEEFEKEVLSE